MARLTWHGHATFLLETDTGKRVMFDPFLDNDPACDIDVAGIHTWDLIAQDPREFQAKVGSRTEVVILELGGSYDF